MSDAAIFESGLDPAADRWTIPLWSAAADLLFCLHACREEGEFDKAGRWRRRHIRHVLAGRPVHQARAAAMARHHCAAVRLSARAYERSRKPSPHARRSFEIGCAERLTERLRAALSAARADPEAGLEHADEAETNLAVLAAAGLERASLDESGIGNWDRAALRLGRAAAENLSLVLRAAPAGGGFVKADRSQMALPF